jgi:DNA-binding HxlR family transcriptional regulator
MLKVTDSMLTNAKGCPIRNVLDEVGNKWSLLVMLSLIGKRRRFMEVKRSIGDITQRVLTQTLRKLERDGYVSRKVNPTSPPTVEYWLTAMGESLLEPMEILIVWANQHFDKVMEARKRFDGVNLASGATSAKPPPSTHKPARELTK